MGSGRWAPEDYLKYATSTAGMSVDDRFDTKTRAALGKAPDPLDPLKVKLDAHGVRMRESRDSVDNPLSTPLIVALDVTGSMGMLADALAGEGLGTLFEEVLSRKPITDPHMMFMAIGDVRWDRAPLQVSQFEADARIIEQLTSIWLEKGGGGNNCESYDLPWYWAANHTAIDSMEKRNKKGYLFTVGDEEAPSGLPASAIQKFLGDDIQSDVSAAEALAMAQRIYNVFHIVVEQGSHARSHIDRVMKSWTDLLGQNVIRLSDHKKLSEVITSTIQVAEGEDPDAVSKSWSGDTSLVVARAVAGLAKSGSAGAVRRL